MKKALINRNTFIVCLALSVTAGAWTFQRVRTRAAASAAPASASVLSAIPRVKSTSHSPTDQHIAKWAKKVEQDEKNDSAWINLGDGLMQKARETMDVDYYNRAEAAYQKALSLDSKNISALNGMAWVAGCRHEFEQSIEWAKKSIALDPKNQSAYGLLGDANVEMGDYEAAYKHYQKMLDVRPDLSSYSRGAHLLFVSGNMRKAVSLMSKAIAAGAPNAENTAWCKAQLALILWNGGYLLPAEQTLTAALKQTPNNYHLLAAMGKVKASRKKYDEAIDFYKKAIAIAPQHDSVVALGDLYTLTGKKDEAEKQYALVEEIHKLNKSNGVRGDAQMARFYADHDRNLPEALQLVEEEYKTRPNVFIADTLAWCYYKNGRIEDAKETIKKALKQKTPDAHILFHAGMIHAKLGDRMTAQNYLYRALSLNPNFHPAHAKVAADTLKQLGSGKGKLGN
jgi:tetratricopeptide (TPR) repeat protein